jgi:hypothetical protein
MSRFQCAETAASIAQATPGENDALAVRSRWETHLKNRRKTGNITFITFAVRSIQESQSV